MRQPPSITRYPDEQHYLRWGASGSFGIHVLFAAVIVLLAFFAHIKTIQELMAEGGSIAQSGPAPKQQMEVVLRLDDLPPPPPTANPEFIKQVELPKPVVVPPPVAVPVPKVKPVVIAKPRFTAPQATGTGESAGVSHLVIGSSGFPQPGYPYEAQVRRQTGTVNVSIRFDASGNAEDVEVIQSSGVSILDTSTQNFIRSHWHNASFAGRTATVPVRYHMD
jgi:TonB family protein